MLQLIIIEMRARESSTGELLTACDSITGIAPDRTAQERQARIPRWSLRAGL
jgi:hypothetical protein